MMTRGCSTPCERPFGFHEVRILAQVIAGWAIAASGILCHQTGHAFSPGPPGMRFHRRRQNLQFVVMDADLDLARHAQEFPVHDA